MYRRVSLSCGSRAFIPSTTLLSSSRFFSPRQPKLNNYSAKVSKVGHAKAGQTYPMDKQMAETCNNLAKVAHNARNLADAISLYDHVLDWRRNEEGPTSDKCAATLHNIGRIFLELKSYASAEHALTEACAIYDHNQGDNKDMRFAESLSMLAVCYMHLNFIPEAEKAFDEALEVSRKLCYDKHRSSWLPPESTPLPQDPQLHPLSGVAHCLNDQAKLLITLNKPEDALASLKDALAIRRYLYSTSHKYRPIIAQTLAKISEVHRVLRDATGAKDTIEEAIDISIETLGRDSPQTAHCMSLKGILLCTMLKFQDAKKFFEEAATTYAVAFGKNSSAYGDELVKLARCHEHLGEITSAEKLFMQGIDILQESAGASHVAVLEAKAYFASLLINVHEYSRAVNIFQQVIAERKKQNENDPKLSGHYHRLAIAMNRMGDTQAEVYFLLAIEKFREGAAVDRSYTLLATDVMDDLGLFYCEHKHFDKAEKMFQDSLVVRLAATDENSMPVAYSNSNLALLYMYQEKYQECESFGVKALKALKDAGQEADQRYIADIQTTLGLNYFSQTRFNEAALYLENSLNTRRKFGIPARAGAAENMFQLARVYIKQEKWPRAKELLTEAKVIAHEMPRLLSVLVREIEKAEKEIPLKDVWPSELRPTTLAPMGKGNL